MIGAKMKFIAGNFVRIKLSAFEDCCDPREIKLRGKVGRLILRVGMVGSEFVWCWKGENNSVAYPLESELELVDFDSDGNDQCKTKEMVRLSIV